MGDVDVDVEPSYGAKHNSNSQPMAQQVSQGLRGHDQVYIGQSRFAGHTNRNSMELEKVIIWILLSLRMIAILFFFCSFDKFDVLKFLRKKLLNTYFIYNLTGPFTWFSG
jgi:hypothetical protein